MTQEHDLIVAGLGRQLARAKKGVADAQYRLGFMYTYSIVGEVPQDHAEAARWYRLAADQGHADAQFSLGGMYDNGEGVPQDDAEAVRLYRLAADQGVALAQVSLGGMYDDGEGVPQDDVQAHMWFNLAASRANRALRDTAIEGRDDVAARMDPTQIAEAQRLALEWNEAHLLAEAHNGGNVVPDKNWLELLRERVSRKLSHIKWS